MFAREGTAAALTDVLITIDTELSESRHRHGMPLDRNLAGSIHGKVAAGSFGIGWQMDRLDAHGHTMAAVRAGPGGARPQFSGRGRRGPLRRLADRGR